MAERASVTPRREDDVKCEIMEVLYSLANIGIYFNEDEGLQIDNKTRICEGLKTFGVRKKLIH